MARIRTIKPDFWTDEKVVALSPLARLLFIGMWNFVDDEGRSEFSPMRIKMQILPADSADISELIGEIRREKLINVYTVDGKEYYQVCGFAKHQKVDARRASKHPPPPSCADLRRVSPTEEEKEEEKEGKGNTDVANATSVRGANEFDEMEKTLRLAAGLENDPSPGLLVLRPIYDLIDAGYQLHRDVLPVLRECKARGKTAQTWAYYAKAVEGKSQAAKPAPKPEAKIVDEVEWITADDYRFASLAERYRQKNGGRDPPLRGGNGGMGYHFRKSWVDERKAK